MRAPFLWRLALALAFLLPGCNTQNAEPPPKSGQASAERPAEPFAPGELPPGHPPIGQSATVKGATITGRISLASVLGQKAPPEAVLFLIARRPGSRAPLAVARIQEVTFPFSYTIGPQHMMTASGRFEGEVEISARLDRDGFVGPPQPGDLMGVYPNNPVSVGDRNIDFKLNKLY
ncbi:MAG: hypothetical protein RX316_09415 [bacterium]|nr:hypothetical protein [bacterium]